MAFSSTVTTEVPTNIGGGLRLSAGTFIDAAAAGSDIVTGLSKVFFCAAIPSTAAGVGCKEAATAGTITVVAENDGTDDGLWVAIGV